MKRMLLLAFILVIGAQYLFAQITLQINIPTVGMIQKDQLWNVLLINNSGAQHSCRLQLLLKDRVTGQEILNASSGVFNVPINAMQLNINTVNPVQYNYLVPATNNSSSMLPVGAYSACYTLVKLNEDQTQLANDCNVFDVEPLSPPFLILPPDSSVLQVNPSQFSWIPPSPAGMFDGLKYDISIVEITQGQSFLDAIEQNIPVYSQHNIQGSTLIYPSTATEFDTTKWYAWQVVARDERTYAARSEVWKFKVSGDSTPVRRNNDMYLQIGLGLSGLYQINSNVLHIKFFSEQREHDADVIFYDRNGSIIKTVTKKIVLGDNYFDFVLSSEFQTNKMYSITITDKSNKRHTLTFSINSK